MLSFFRRKKTRVRENGIHEEAQKRYISPICTEAFSRWIYTKFGLGDSLAEVINCAEFCYSRLRSFDTIGGQNSLYSVNFTCRRYHAAYGDNHFGSTTLT